MALQTCTGGMMQCTFGVAPSTFMATPSTMVKSSNMTAGNIMDFKPMVNIKPFGMCTSPSNPMVMAATAAAMGVLTPMPCIPNTVAPWTPGAATVMLENFPALNNSSQLMCIWGGTITFTDAGQMTHNIP